ELCDPTNLRWGRNRVIKIPDHADADACIVNLVRAGRWKRGQLLVPALADLDFAVVAAVAVSDDEMIAQPAGRLANGQGIARGGVAVVNVNVFPVRWNQWRVRVEDLVEARRGIDREQTRGSIGDDRRGRQRHEQRAGERQNAQKGGEDDDFAMRLFHGPPDP